MADVGYCEAPTCDDDSQTATVRVGDQFFHEDCVTVTLDEVDHAKLDAALSSIAEAADSGSDPARQAWWEGHGWGVAIRHGRVPFSSLATAAPKLIVSSADHSWWRGFYDASLGGDVQDFLAGENDEGARRRGWIK